MKILRKILFPFAMLYGLIMLLRNFLYSRGILSSEDFEIPVIGVGNLSVGGTGKTPMIEYLLGLLAPDYRTATLSRGYGRLTSGFRILDGNEEAKQVGDEPLQFKNKFRDVTVAVDEQRKRGIILLREKCNPEVVLLDDAFQHRKVKAGFYILLTSYGDLYVDDFMLPMGNLREPVVGAERANLIVVTKCPRKLSLAEQKAIKKKLKLKQHQRLYFSYIEYSERIYAKSHHLHLQELTDEKITLITGIANPKPLLDFLNSRQVEYEHYNFPDHHNFTSADLEKIIAAPTVLTTEKDYMRLKESLLNARLYYIPIKMKFLKNAGEFEENIEEYIANTAAIKNGVD